VSWRGRSVKLAVDAKKTKKRAEKFPTHGHRLQHLRPSTGDLRQAPRVDPVRVQTRPLPSLRVVEESRMIVENGHGEVMVVLIESSKLRECLLTFIDVLVAREKL
jgi:hypothetical protein